MQIDLLADAPEFIPLFAYEMAEHWQEVIPGESFKKRWDQLHEHKNRDCMPIVWVAHDEGVPFGTSSLRTCDLPGREDLTP